MLWDEADQDAYASVIKETLLRFFAPLCRKEVVNEDK
jgi:hypothetical protein